jgi:hypothetical protein
VTSRCVHMGEGHPFPGKLKEIIISCDNIDCTVAVNDTTIQAEGGLKKMGWEAAAIDGTMRHYCPKHRRTPRSN